MGKNLIEINKRLSWKQYNYIDENGKTLLKENVYDATEFNDGHAIIGENIDGEYVKEILDENGEKIVVSNEYLIDSKFSDGLAVIKENRKTAGVVHNLDYINKIGINGYIDVYGDVVIEPQFKYAFDFKNNQAIVVKDFNLIDENNNFIWNGYEKWGVINKNQEVIIPFEYADIQAFEFNNKIYYCVAKGDLNNANAKICYGILNQNNNVVMDIKYGCINVDVNLKFCNRYILFSYNDLDDIDIKYGIFDLEMMNIILEPCFKQIYVLDDNYIKFSNNDEFDFNCRFGVFDLKNKNIIVSEECIDIIKIENQFKILKCNMYENNLKVIGKNEDEMVANNVIEYYYDNKFNIICCGKIYDKNLIRKIIVNK